jgi:hypothetical protein
VPAEVEVQQQDIPVDFFEPADQPVVVQPVFDGGEVAQPEVVRHIPIEAQVIIVEPPQAAQPVVVQPVPEQAHIEIVQPPVEVPIRIEQPLSEDQILPAPVVGGPQPVAEVVNEAVIEAARQEPDKEVDAAELEEANFRKLLNNWEIFSFKSVFSSYFREKRLEKMASGNPADATITLCGKEYHLNGNTVDLPYADFESIAMMC